MFDWNEYWFSHRESKEVREFNIFLSEKISKELIDRPVKQGYYAIDVYFKGKVIVRVYSSYEPYKWDIRLGNININTFADFRVVSSG